MNSRIARPIVALARLAFANTFVRRVHADRAADRAVDDDERALPPVSRCSRADEFRTHMALMIVNDDRHVLGFAPAITAAIATTDAVMWRRRTGSTPTMSPALIAIASRKARTFVSVGGTIGQPVGEATVLEEARSPRTRRRRRRSAASQS